MPLLSRLALTSLLASAAVLVGAPGTNGSTPSARLTDNSLDPILLPLDNYFDNDGIDSADIRDGNFDGSGYVYPAEELPAAGAITVESIPFLFPSSAPCDMNNVFALGQEISLPPVNYHVAYLLLAASYSPSSSTATFDGATRVPARAGTAHCVAAVPFGRLCLMKSFQARFGGRKRPCLPAGTVETR